MLFSLLFHFSQIIDFFVKLTREIIIHSNEFLRAVLAFILVYCAAV